MSTAKVSQSSRQPLSRVPYACKDEPSASSGWRLIRYQLLSLPQLEILDLSVNEIRMIPENIRSMRSLRVLSLTKNKIWNVPTCIKDLDTLRMLKLAGNPLRSDLASIVEAKDIYLPFDEAVTDNKKETFITSNLKHHLKVEAASGSGEGSRWVVYFHWPLRSLMLDIVVKALWKRLAHLCAMEAFDSPLKRMVTVLS